LQADRMRILSLRQAAIATQLPKNTQHCALCWPMVASG
jgi:hypothetical protein